MEQAKLVGLASGLATSIVVWWHGLNAQRQRLADGLEEMTPSRWADVSLFAVCLRNVQRVAYRCQLTWDKPTDSPFTDALSVFDQNVPNTLEIRNIVEHFDKQQVLGEYAVMVTHDPQGWLSLHVNDHRIDINEAVDHAKTLADRCVQLLNLFRVLNQ
jgi:hypothetical protein